MKFILRAHSGEWGEIYMAVVDVNPLQITDIWDRWPDFEGLSAMVFADNVDWLEGGNMDVIDILDGGVVKLDDDVDEDDIRVQGLHVGAHPARVECEDMIVNKDSVRWEAIVKHTDIRCDTDMLGREELLTAAGVLKEVCRD